jgi:hypothetical protein
MKNWRYINSHDWFIDSVYNYDPTDDIIDSIDEIKKEDNYLEGLIDDIQSILTPLEYDIVIDHIIEKRTFREIAKEKGYHASWCHILFHKAIEKLRINNIILSYLRLEDSFKELEDE